MDTSLPDSADPVLTVTRVAEHLWHALEDDQVVGRAHTTRRSDGRLFVSIDTWHEAVFHHLAGAVLKELPRPLFTVLDEADADLTAAWLMAGFSIARRELGYVVPTDPRVTGLGGVRVPADVTIIPAGAADEGALRALYRALRAEIDATVGWRTMPAEVLPRPEGPTAADLPQFVVAAQGSEYVGLLRLATATRQPRIGLLAVRAAHQRRGIGRALLAHSLDVLHRGGVWSAWAEVNEGNAAASALFERAGAHATTRNLELAAHR
ncbi:MAG: GNAT family N-acetyltransferase [Catenulispora sp.]|nr:GNAT family N-acetyltransferase [Catenulispora sp.]